MDRLALLRDARTGQAPGLEWWLLLAALLGLLCGWIAQRAPAPVEAIADLAVGHGLPMLEDVLDAGAVTRLLRDLDDPWQAVHSGSVPVAVDAGPDGVQVLYRADAAGSAPPAVAPLLARWPDADVQVLVEVGHPHRLLPLLIAVVGLNLSIAAVWFRFRRLGRGAWWRWLALQGVLSPDLLLALLARQAMKVLLVALIALLVSVGSAPTLALLAPIALLTAGGAAIGLLGVVAKRPRGLLLLVLAQLSLAPVLFAPLVAEQTIVVGRWWGSAALLLGVVAVSLLAMRHRLIGWCRGEFES